MPKRANVASLKKIEGFDLVAVGFSGIQGFKAFHQHRTTHGGSADGWEVRKCQTLCIETQGFANNQIPNGGGPISVGGFRACGI